MDNQGFGRYQEEVELVKKRVRLIDKAKLMELSPIFVVMSCLSFGIYMPTIIHKKIHKREKKQ